MAIFENVKNKWHEVRDLSYLVSKASRLGLSDIEVTHTHKPQVFNLYIHYSNGDLHHSTWADGEALAGWLRAMRAWHGTPINWISTDGTLGAQFPTGIPVPRDSGGPT